MIAAQHHRQRARIQHGAHAEFDIGMAGLGIGMHDVGVADIDDA